MTSPIDFAFTGTDGGFEFHRPAGEYWVEVFAKDVLFRPPGILVDAPIDNVIFFVEQGGD